MTTATIKANIKLITISRLEGRDDQCGSTTHTSWESANDRIRKICASAPTDGCYHKCDVVAIWDNGDSYAFRYDAARVGSTSHEGTVSERIRSGLLYSAGLQCPTFIDDAAYQASLATAPGRVAEATNMLKTLHFVDIEDTPEFKEIPLMAATAPTLPIRSAIDLARESMKAEADALRARTIFAKTGVIVEIPTPAARAARAVPAPAPAPVTRSITPPQGYRAAAPQTKGKKDPIDSLPPTDIRRRIKALIAATELVGADAAKSGYERGEWAKVVGILNTLKGI